jgi:uncharacterized repeat protein (TIGR01451 family)
MDETNQNLPPVQTPPQEPQLAPAEPATPIVTVAPEKFSLKAFLKENKWSVWLITGSLVVIAIAAFFAFRKPSSNVPTQPNVSVNIDAPDKISSGSEVIYKINVKNDDSSTIRNVTVDLVYPNGFTFVDSSPKPSKLNGTQFALPSMDSGQSATIMIKGDIQGNADEVKTISATMHYRFANFSSDFIVQAQAQSHITTADFALDFSGPTAINTDQEVTYTLNYANYTDKQVSGLRISMITPTAFVVSASSPQPSLGKTWDLGTLDSNSTGKITITGAFKNANIGDNQTFTAKAEGSVDDKPSYVLSTGQLQVTIAQTPLEASVSMDATSLGKDVVSPGDNLQYKVAFRNNGSSPARGVIVTAHLDGEAFDLDRISASRANVNGDTITWDASQNDELESLGSGEGGEFTFSVPVFNPATRSNRKELTVRVSLDIKSQGFDQPFAGKEASAKVQTVADITKAVTYVSGSNPPIIGLSTTYMVIIGLKNETNDITDGKMTFNLPNASSFSTAAVNSEERANVTYEANSKKITWNVGKLVAHAGGFVPQRKLQFNNTVTPGISLKGSPITLVNNIKFTGTDSFTLKPISLSEPSILSTDEPSGQGTVGQ